MEQIDFRGASINALGKHIGGALRQHAKKQGGITALAEKSGVSRSTLNRLFSGQAVGLDSLLRVLRSLECWDVLNELCKPPSLTPIEKFEVFRRENKHLFKKDKTKPSIPEDRFDTIPMADPQKILASLKKKD